MKCYKLAKIRDGEYVSSSTTGSYKLRYRVGERVKPKIGKIFVYKTLDKAKDHLTQGRIILECECDNMQKIESISFIHYYIGRIFNHIGTAFLENLAIKYYWSGWHYNMYKVHDVYVCDSLKVLREVTG